MDKYSQPKEIKPLNTPQTTTLKSLSTYQKLLLRRPKNTVAFKFSWEYTYSNFTNGCENKAQAKLFHALKHLKYLKKADLTGFKVNEFTLNPTLSNSIYKKIAKVKSLSVKRIASFPHEKKHFTDKWLKYFSALEGLDYGLAVDAKFESDENLIAKSNDPLGHLKYCPKIQSLNLDISGASPYYDEVFIQFGYFPTLLKHLSIKSSLDLNELNLPLEKFQQLQSINFSLPSDHWSHYMNALSNLPFLRNLNLTIHPSLSSHEFLTIWRKITSQRQLKKLHLFLGSNFPTTPDLFQALNGCQLTHFSLRLHTSNPHLLLSISQCLNSQPQLQSLQLQIFGSFSFNEAAGFPEICSQVSSLEALCHLQLSFFPLGRFANAEKFPHFISYFQKTFTKSIKIETLSLSCIQADPEIMLKELISALRDSCSSLQRLKIDLFCSTEVEFFQSLENIRELELPGFHVKDQKTLRILVEIVEKLKNLTVLEIGKIGGPVTESEYANGIKRILKKRGLKKFVCKTEKYITDENIKIDGKGVLRRNPFLEAARMFDELGGNLNQDIYTWI